ncbi:hypothetical protein RJT34_12018 [Clitoria ternatea]|uniref:Uncharacterized protein n=1 Tax=Clitoria ternatea TaxID=43366 RepID=A0AAN9PL00_CLITE
MAVYTGTTPGAQLPIDPSPHHCVEKVETTIDEAERVVDIVEDVAEKVDELAEEAVKHLPEGKLRDAVEFVENVAEDIDQHAENAEDALQKVLIFISISYAQIFNKVN